MMSPKAFCAGPIMRLIKLLMASAVLSLSACAWFHQPSAYSERLIITPDTTLPDTKAIRSLIEQKNYQVISAIDIYFSQANEAAANRLGYWFYKNYRYYPVKHQINSPDTFYVVITGHHERMKKKPSCYPWMVDDFNWYQTDKQETNIFQFRDNCTYDFRVMKK